MGSQQQGGRGSNDGKGKRQTHDQRQKQNDNNLTAKGGSNQQNRGRQQ